MKFDVERNRRETRLVFFRLSSLLADAQSQPTGVVSSSTASRLSHSDLQVVASRRALCNQKCMILRLNRRSRCYL